MKKMLRRQGGAMAEPAKAAPSDIPIIWVERTGVVRCHRGHWCDDCKIVTQVQTRLTEWEEPFPDPRPLENCRKCQRPVPMNSRGLDEEMHAPSTGEVFERWRDVPVGAVWARERRDGELHNWISNVDSEGQPFPEPAEGEGRRIRFVDRPHPDDGRVLICRLPDGHDWEIDSRCNNCTLPLDDVHWCWNRSGRPEDGTLDVRKGKPGQTTCAAGAGSIQTGRWHGFLWAGYLHTC